MSDLAIAHLRNGLRSVAERTWMQKPEGLIVSRTSGKRAIVKDFALASTHLTSHLSRRPFAVATYLNDPITGFVSSELLLASSTASFCTWTLFASLINGLC